MEYPLIALALFMEPFNVAILLVVSFHGVLVIGSKYYLPLYFQSVKEASAVKSGVLLVSPFVTTSWTNFVSGFIIHQISRYREVVWLGPVLLTLEMDSTFALTRPLPSVR